MNLQRTVHLIKLSVLDDKIVILFVYIIISWKQALSDVIWYKFVELC